MPRIQRRILIHRPVDEVFAFFTEPRNDPTWRPHVKEISATEPLGVGSTVHQLVKGPAGRRIPADLEVTAYDPQARYAFKVTQGPLRPTGEFRFTPVGGDTEVAFELRAELHGVKKFLLGRTVERTMESEVAGLDKAKAALETS